MAIKKGDKIIQQFEGDNPPEDFDFPSIGIEDIDRAVFKLFDEKLRFQTTQKGESKKVPVVFAAGERFALTRRKNPIRDKNNALILPIISVMRGNIDFSTEVGGKKSPISFREQPTYTIKRRLSNRDRQYQNILNKMGLTNQKNVASRRNLAESDIVPGNVAVADTIASRRSGKNLTFISQGGNISLDPGHIQKNIFEIIEIPYPEFIGIEYDIVFWTQYLSQANQMMETLLLNFEGQGEEITMKTDAGYELVAFFKPPFTSNANFDNYTDDERVIKHTITMTVPGYILNPKHPGVPNLMRTYTSAPMIDFSYDEPRANVVFNNQPERKDEETKRHILNDLTNIDEIKGERRGETSEDIEQVIVNPFTGEEEVSFSKVLSRNKRTGETVVSSLIVKKIERQYE